MKFYLITAAVFFVAWLVAWFAFIRPALKHYKFTAGIIDRLDAAEGDAWAKIRIWLEAKKLLVIGFVTSGFTTVKATVDHATSTVSAASNIDPSALQPLQDKGLWSAFFGDITTLHIVGAVTILMTILHVKGLVTAAKIVPADPKA